MSEEERRKQLELINQLLTAVANLQHGGHRWHTTIVVCDGGINTARWRRKYEVTAYDAVAAISLVMVSATQDLPKPNPLDELIVFVERAAPTI
jgi:hypothetical protein